jgi:hypothetical protein
MSIAVSVLTTCYVTRHNSVAALQESNPNTQLAILPTLIAHLNYELNE